MEKTKYKINEAYMYTIAEVLHNAVSVKYNGKVLSTLGYDEYDDILTLEDYVNGIDIANASKVIDYADIKVGVSINLVKPNDISFYWHESIDVKYNWIIP